MLINGKELLRYSEEKNIAIPAFGCVNLEGIKAVIQAAEKFDYPVIVQMTEGGIKYAGLEALYTSAVAIAEKSKAKICIHLDHGRNLELVKNAIDLGFTSVMYDGSHLSIEENIKNAKIIKDYIGMRSIALEVEIGAIGGKEDDIDAEGTLLADLEEVQKMNEEVNPDSLAVAVGTSHGVYKGPVNIDFELIKKAKEITNKPLVLHGTSGVPTEQVKKAIINGINKVNYDTELKQEFIKGIKNYMTENSEEYDIRKIFKCGIDQESEIVAQRIIDCVKITNYENIN